MSLDNYVCSKQNHEKSTCVAKAIPAGAIEGLIMDYLKDIPLDGKLISLITEKANEKARDLLESARILHRRGVETLNHTKTQINNLMDVISTQGAAAFVSLKGRLAELETEKATLEKSVIDQEENKIALEERMSAAQNMIATLEGLHQILEKASPERKASILPYFIKAIHVTQDGADPSRGKVQLDVYEHLESDSSFFVA